MEPSRPLWLWMFASYGRFKLEISTSVFSAEMKAGLGEYRFYPCYAFVIFSAMEVSRCKWESGFWKGSHQMGAFLSINGPGPVACHDCCSFSLERGPESAAFPLFTLKGLDLVLGYWCCHRIHVHQSFGEILGLKSPHAEERGTPVSVTVCFNRLCSHK